ncbi:hypothetical protein [Agrobacterium rosae]
MSLFLDRQIGKLSEVLERQAASFSRDIFDDCSNRRLRMHISH